MSLIRPNRRELLAAIPLVVGASAFAGPVFAQAAQKPPNFLVVGDWGRGGHHNQQAVADRMGAEAAAKGSQFIASTGDNFYMLGVSSIHDTKWRSSFEDVYAHPAFHAIPWYPVLGNHDYGGNVEAQIHYGREVSPRWKMDGRHYHPPIAMPGGVSVDFFFIDTVTWIGREGFPFSFLGSEISATGQRDQAVWLVNALGASTARFKFVFGHHGIHSIGPHGGEMQMAQLDNVLRRFGVTAYVHGHDHCLFHISHNGMDYICSGGGSKVLATYTGGREPGCVYNGFCDPSGSDVPFPRWHSFIRDAGFASFDIYPDRVDFDLVSLNNIPGPSYHASLYSR
jgi:tartrate-resistant acid phosphatase type 5